MDTFRLGEVSSNWVEEEDTKAQDTTKRIEERIMLLESRLDDLITLLIPARLQKLEERINLMMDLKKVGLDISKFTFDLKPL